jgi:hypothetical protein
VSSYLSQFFGSSFIDDDDDDDNDVRLLVLWSVVEKKKRVRKEKEKNCNFNQVKPQRLGINVFRYLDDAWCNIGSATFWYNRIVHTL